MNATGMKVLGAMNYHQKQASKSLERLSTGLRINSAADDPAGLAMAERMTSEINGARQAARNIAAGQDMAKTADSALACVQDAIQRFRELAGVLFFLNIVFEIVEYRRGYVLHY
jgi:flagellin